ncbi:hypothetical protein llap_133 [Limosa lapponica baueri]|uniref:Uncharacterized protein n=1 Tax=Limosa lapponica baueri TaxID=1758121 RepID=A0A2I0UU60_LIMLA|nr:hypothetical protein llap_133 [Limosa lapponica baueri]
MPASSKIDPLLGEAESISDGAQDAVGFLGCVHLQRWRIPMLEQVPEGGCDLMGSLVWSRLLAGPMDLWREKPILEQVYWQDL